MKWKLALAGLLLGFGLVSPLRAQPFVNFESGPVRPLALSSSGQYLYAVNTPDNRLEIFEVSRTGLRSVGEVLVGLEPVAVAAAEQRVYVVNHLSDSVSVVDVSRPELPEVVATLWTGDEPRDIVLAGESRDRIVVTAARRGQNLPSNPELTTPGVGRADVWIFDTANLDAPAAIITLFADTPRGLAVTPDGRTVYAAAFHSGNRTTILNAAAISSQLIANVTINDGFTGLGPLPPLANDEGIPAPPTGLIVRQEGGLWSDEEGRDWTPRVRFDLPDRDVFSIDMSVDPPVVTGDYQGVGTVLFNLAVHPTDGRVYVSNLESRNLVRFEPQVNGHTVENQISILSPEGVTSVHLNPHIDYRRTFGPAEEIRQSLSTPLDLTFSQDGSRLYVTAFGSDKVAVLDRAGAVQQQIRVGAGPAGLALDESLDRLYVYNRFDLSISVVDLRLNREIRRQKLRYNPEPEEIQVGRRLLYDGRNSGHGDQSCASCHIFADFDSLAWDLGDPGGVLEENPLVRVPVQDGPFEPFHPMKGPMTTQSLRGMAGAGAMHWRGDRNGGTQEPFDEGLAFLQFRKAFQSLLGKETPLPVQEMERFRDFILTVRYPPNPIANLDGTLTAQQQAGLEILESEGNRLGLGGDGDPCSSCHDLPLGTAGLASFEGFIQSFKVPHMRNLYQKIGMYGTALPRIVRNTFLLPDLEPTPTPHMGEQVRGYGFLHDGSVPNLFDFFRFAGMQFTFRDEPNRSGNRKVRELESFLLAFPTGLDPSVGQQVTLTSGSPASAWERFELLVERARSGVGDLVLSGTLEGEQRGLLLEAGSGEMQFRSDRQGQTYPESELRTAAAEGRALLTAMLVPPGSGYRIGIDRDQDSVLNLDERRSGRPFWVVRP